MRVYWAPPDAVRELGLGDETADGSRPLALDEALDLCAWLRERRSLLLDRSTRDVVYDLGRVVARWLDRRESRLQDAAERLSVATGYAEPVVARSLEHFFRSHRTPLLRGMLLPALVELAALNRLSASGRRSRAYGPALTLLFASGNVPVAALPSLCHSLLVRSPCLARVSGAETVMLPLFARSLWEIAPLLGAAVAVLGWEPAEEEVTRALMSRAEGVIAYGDDETVRTLRGWAMPRARFLGYGHRVAFGVLGREYLTTVLAAKTAAAAAADVGAFDQQGCMSPQWFYVEEGGNCSPEEFAKSLAGELEALQREWPRRTLSPAEASAIHQERAAWEVRADARLWRSPGTEWTVVYTPDAAPEGACLNRFVLVRPLEDVVRGLPDLTELGPHLQTVCCALRRSRAIELADRLGPLGVTRICPVGKTQYPAPLYHHDGRAAIQELLRWVAVEQGVPGGRPA